MKNTKKLRDYMPAREEDKCQLNATVPKSLHEAAYKLLKRENRTWSELLTAALKQFIEESKESP